MSKINQKFISVLSFIFFLLGDAIAGDLYQLLPDSTQVAPFLPSDSIVCFTKNNLHKLINNAADIYMEYGFTTAIKQQYSYDLITFSVDIFEMEDSDAAFGIYSMFRDPKSPPLGLGTDGVEYAYQVAFWQDKYYIVIAGNDGSDETKAIIKKTANEISNKMATAQLPEILNELPQQHLEPRSQGTIEGVLALNRKLYLGRDNILNINGESVQAAFGSYKYDEEIANIILVKTGHIENAQKRVNDIFRTKYSTQFKKEIEIFKDQRGRFYCAYSGKHLLIVYKASSHSIIEHLFD